MNLNGYSGILGGGQYSVAVHTCVPSNQYSRREYWDNRKFLVDSLDGVYNKFND